MSNKIMSSGELLSNLNKNISKEHHKKPDQSLPQADESQKPESPVIKQAQNQKAQPDKSIKKKQGQHQKQTKKAAHGQKDKNNEKPEQQPKRADKDNKRQTEMTQNKTIRSNLSRASQIVNKKSSFHNNFDSDNLSVMEEELGETLHEILAMQIGKLISEPLAQVIQASMKQRENSIFIAYTQSNHNYLENLIEIEKKKQDNNMNEIEALLAKRQTKTMEKLDNGQLFIDRERAISTKSQLQDLTKLDVARLVKIKEGAIRSKLDLLHDKIFEIQALENSSKISSESLKKYQQQKLEQITDPSNFSLTSQKTKIAHDYVKHLQHQKMMLLKNMRQRQQKRLQKQKQRQTELKEAQQMRKQVKKQEIQQKAKEYKQKKQHEIAELNEKSKKVEQFLKEYRKSMPLYKKKQKQFTEVHEKKRRKEMEERLKSIKQDRRSLSLNEIKQHEDKYLQRKSLDHSKKEEEFKLLMKSRRATESTKEHFKGFFHDKVKLMDQEQKLKFYSLRESTKVKIERMTEFDQKIRKLHKPKVDVKKKEELERVIELEEMKKKKVKKAYKQVTSENGQTRLEPYYEEIPDVDHYKEGNKYMEIAKSLAKKKRPQQTSRYSEQPEINLEELQKAQRQKASSKKTDIVDWQNPSPIVSQEKDLWRLRGKQLHQMTDDVNSQNFHQIKKNLQIMDDKAKMREDLLKHKESDAHEQMHEKSMLDEFYLESIKNKIKLLNE